MNPEPSKSRAALRAILAGGAVAGILDIIFAFLFYGARGATPVRILQSVASGLLGKESFEGGAPTAVLGAVLQLVIPTLAAAVYFGFTQAVPSLRSHAIASGLVFGIGVYVVMNFVVVPLSAAPPRKLFPVQPALVLPALVAHMFLVGLPIGLANRKYLPEN